MYQKHLKTPILKKSMERSELSLKQKVSEYCIRDACFFFYLTISVLFSKLPPPALWQMSVSSCFSGRLHSEF